MNKNLCEEIMERSELRNRFIKSGSKVEQKKIRKETKISSVFITKKRKELLKPNEIHVTDREIL